MSVSEQIIQVIDALCEKFGIVINWTSDNVIPYIEVLGKKLVTYEICTSIVWIFIMLSLSISSIIAAKKLTPIFKKNIKETTNSWGLCTSDWDIGAIFAIIGFVALNGTSIIVIIYQIMDIIKCFTFPELYIFEYISKFIAQ